MSDQDDLLPISQINHYVFCRRLFGLCCIDTEWAENHHTIMGEIFHDRVHDSEERDWRNGVLTLRNLAVVSRKLGMTGRCDAVEFHPDANGVPLHGEQGLFVVYPVEYKKGSHRTDGAAEAQLCAEAMCLEEMLCCSIPEGALYYGESRRRVTVAFDAALRTKVETICREMHDCFNQRYVPKVTPGRQCQGCSLADLCLPKLIKRPKSVADYIREVMDGS